MKTSSRSLALCLALLLMTGAFAPLFAQGNVITFPVAIPLTRSYAGSIRQTAADGTVTTSAFTLGLNARGELSGSATVNGKSTTYYGVVARTHLDEKRTNGSGYLVALQFTILPVGLITITPLTPVASDGITVQVNPDPDGKIGSAEITRIPLVITPTAAYGGLLNADGSSLLFRCERVTDATPGS